MGPPVLQTYSLCLIGVTSWRSNLPTSIYYSTIFPDQSLKCMIRTSNPLNSRWYNQKQDLYNQHMIELDEK